MDPWIEWPTFFPRNAYYVSLGIASVYLEFGMRMRVKKLLFYSHDDISRAESGIEINEKPR